MLTTLLIASALPILEGAGADQDIIISALDANKAPVAELAPGDIAVREDGMAREVLRVRKATTPLTIALLVDDSAAATPAAADIRRGLLAFFEAFETRPEIALITFGDRSTLAVDYTRDLERLKNGAERIFPRRGSGAYLLDAIVETSRGLEKRTAERPVIVAIVTEGIEFSNVTYPLVLRRLHASGASFHALVLGMSDPAHAMNEEVRNRNIVLDEGTRTTGGRRDQLLASLAIAPALKELAAELEHQWVVTYSRPDALVPPERVQVEARREGLTVRAPTRVQEIKAPR